MNKQVARVEIKGELNIFTAASLRQLLLDAFAAGTEVEVDLSQVSEMDSAGMQLLVAAKRESALIGKPLRYTGHSPAVIDLIERCDLAGHLGDPVLIHPQA